MDKPIKNIYQRVLGVMEDVEYIQKSDKKVNNMYRFVSHDQVTGKLHPFLVKHGIVVVPNVKSREQNGNMTIICLDVAFINADKPEDLIRIESWGYGIDGGGKDQNGNEKGMGDKGPGKAVSYAFKYALLKIFCLETGDDPDNDAHAEHIPDANLRHKKDDAISPREKSINSMLTLEEFYNTIFPYMPEHNDPSFGSTANMLEYLNTMVTKTRHLNELMHQAMRSEEMMKRFCSSWLAWHKAKS